MAERTHQVRAFESLAFPTSFLGDVGFAGEVGSCKRIGLAIAGGADRLAILLASVLRTVGLRPGFITGRCASDSESYAVFAGGSPDRGAWYEWSKRIEDLSCSHAILEVAPSLEGDLSQTEFAGQPANLDLLCMRGPSRVDSSVVRAREPKFTERHGHRALAGLSPLGLAVLNADDPDCRALLANHSGPAITFGVDAPAEFTATVIEEFASEQTILLNAEGETVPLRVPLVGRESVFDLLAAATIAWCYGISLVESVRGLESANRFRPCGNGVEFQFPIANEGSSRVWERN